MATQVQEVEVEANSEDAACVDSVEEGLAKEQRLSWGTQEQLSNGGDVKSPVLQGKGRNKEPAAAGGRKRLETGASRRRNLSSRERAHTTCQATLQETEQRPCWVRCQLACLFTLHWPSA